MAALDKRCSQLQKEKELIEKKMQRIEKAKETETGELRSQLEAVQSDIQAQLKLKDSKITEVRSYLRFSAVLPGEIWIQSTMVCADHGGACCY